jgi:CBS domain-containing protein
MTRRVISVPAHTRLNDVARLFTEQRVGVVPIVSADGQVLGIVSRSDLAAKAGVGTRCSRSWWLRIIDRFAKRGKGSAGRERHDAQQVMTRCVYTAAEDMTLSEVVDVMRTRRLKRLPVVRGGHLVGIISRVDVMEAASC